MATPPLPPHIPMSNKIQPCPDYSKFVDWVKENFDMHLNARDYYFMSRVLRIRSYNQVVALDSYSPQEWYEHLGPEAYATYLPNIVNLAIILDLANSNNPNSWSLYQENIEHCYEVMLEDYGRYSTVDISEVPKPSSVPSMSSKPPPYTKVSPTVQEGSDNHHSKKEKSKSYRTSSPKAINSHGNPDPDGSSSSSSSSSSSTSTKRQKRVKRVKVVTVKSITRVYIMKICQILTWTTT